MDKNTGESLKANPNPRQAFGLVFGGGLLVVIALLFVACLLGFHAGLGFPSGGDARQGIFLLPLFAIDFFLLVRLGIHWGRPIYGTYAAFAIVLFLLLANGFSTAYTFGENRTGRYWMHDKMLLRTLGGALEAYHADGGAYPPSLEKLLGSSSYAKDKAINGQSDRPCPGSPIPSSAFGQGLPVHYALGDPDPKRPGNTWFLWLPGPDCKYDIQDGPELKATLNKMQKGAVVPWMCNRTYDPSNGVSGGDIFQIQGLVK